MQPIWIPAALLLSWVPASVSHRAAQGPQPMDFLSTPDPHLASNNTPVDRTIPSFHAFPAVELPEGSILLHNGSVWFPNGTVLLTKYSSQVDSARMAAAVAAAGMFFNSSVLPPIVANRPTPAGVTATPLNPSDYPYIILPRNSLVYRNGTISVLGRINLPTLFKNGFIPDCFGVACHHYQPPEE